VTDPPEMYYRIGTSLLREFQTDDHRIMALYLLTCRHRTTEGLFFLPQAYIAADLDWTAKRATKAFEAIERSGMVRYDRENRVCLIEKALKWQAPSNPNQVTAALRKLDPVPPSPLWAAFYGLAEQYCERLAEGLRQRFPERLGDGLGERVAYPFPKPPSLALTQPRKA